MAEASRQLRAWASSRMTNGNRVLVLRSVADTLNRDVRGEPISTGLVERVLLGESCPSHPVIERIRLELVRRGLL